jgi:hypothetical protein
VIISNINGAAPVNWGGINFFDFQNNLNNRKERASLANKFRYTNIYDDLCNNILLDRQFQISFIRAEIMVSHVNDL